MTEREFKLHQQTARRNMAKTFLRGLKRIFTRSDMTLLFMAITILIAVLVGRACNQPRNDLIDLSAIMTPGYCLLGVMAVIVTVYILGIIPQAKAMQDNLLRSGIVNYAQEAPTVEDIEHLDDRLQRITFESRGIRAEKWIEEQQAVESALDLVLLRIEDGEDMHHVTVLGVPPRGALPEKILWHPALSCEKKHTIVLGESQASLVSVDLLRTPHWLIGAATGGGKTQLILLIIEQLLEKGMHITVADWKQGMDFSPRIQSQCKFVSDYESLQIALSEIGAVMAERALLYRSAQQQNEEIACNNTEVYRRLTGKALEHHVLIVDEASMVLDSTGASKDEKTMITEITRKIVDIGRIGRSYGVHLMICTQRPDVNSIPGAIKANLDGRIAGHMADNTASMVILDNANAAKLPSIPGRFIIRDGTGTEQIFQAYLLPEASI